MKEQKQLAPGPPEWGVRFLKWFCAPDLVETIEGDLHEEFVRQARLVGERKARLLYWLEVLGFLKPRYIKSKKRSLIYAEFSSSFLFSHDMIRSYFKIAFRSFWHNKSMSAINILGLTLGLASSILIFLWVQDEISTDRYHASGPQLYRLMWRQISDGKRMAMAATPGPTAGEFKRKYPEIEQAAVFTARSTRLTFKVGSKVGKETGDWVGADWFKMFSIKLLAGSAETALSNPYGISISHKLAQTYFGGVEGAIGKSIRIENKDQFQVTAVFEDLPENTSQKYDFLLPWDDFLKRQPWAKEWGNPSPWTLVQLRTDTDAHAFDAKIKHALRSYLGIDAKNKSRYDVELFLQPYEDIYLHSETENGEISGGRIDNIQLLGIVGVFLLLIACINFMNLSTARAAQRAKEVGVRKVVGADRSRLIIQFIGEAFLLTMLAALFALGLISFLLPSFNELTGKKISLLFTDFSFILSVFVIVATTGILAGIYPAFYLSALKPVSVFKGAIRFKHNGTVFRQVLVVVQFTVSMVLIIGTFVVYHQMNFIQKKNLGFDRENLIYVPLEGALLEKYGTLKQELKDMPGIQSVSRMDYQPGNINSGTTWVDWTGKDPAVSIEFAQVSVGYDMDRVLEMNLRDGHYFSKVLASDSTGYVINEQAARRIGYTNPVGRQLTFWGKPGKILGVMKDFHFQSLREPVKPLIMWFGEHNTYGNLLVRTQPGQAKQALASLEAVCKKLNPEFLFTYTFADQEYDKMYKSEQVIATLGNYFAGLSIFIACLGLFGLASFTAQQRTKEIGIRKVLGATVISIIQLLSNDFLKLVFIAILIACPAAWWAMDKWLRGFVYKEELSLWTFAVTGGFVTGIALLTVSFQSIRAALTNPAISLKTE